MTSTRPIVNFSVPKENSPGFGENPTKTGEAYQYSSLTCEGCDKTESHWYGTLMITIGIIALAIGVLLFARKYIFKIHETSRN